MMITLTDRAAIPDAEAAALASTQSITFKEAAARYIAVHRKGLRTPSTRHNGGRPSRPILDKVLVRNIDVAHVHRVLEPTWTAKARDRSRVRGRIEKSPAGRSWPCQIKAYGSRRLDVTDRPLAVFASRHRLREKEAEILPRQK